MVEFLIEVFPRAGSSIDVLVIPVLQHVSELLA